VIKYSTLNLGQIVTIGNKLGGEQGIEDLLAGKLLVQRPKKVIATYLPMKLGDHLKSPSDFIAQFKDESGCSLTDDALRVIQSDAFEIMEEETEIELVMPTVGALGFSKAVSRLGIYRRAHELGLEMVPPEVGPRLRLHEDTAHLVAYIGMHPIYVPPVPGDGPRSVPLTFFLKHGNFCGIILGAENRRHQRLYGTNEFFVFMRAPVAM
jgi:hypothetical protein